MSRTKLPDWSLRIILWSKQWDKFQNKKVGNKTTSILQNSIQKTGSASMYDVMKGIMPRKMTLHGSNLQIMITNGKAAAAQSASMQESQNVNSRQQNIFKVSSAKNENVTASAANIETQKRTVGSKI